MNKEFDNITFDYYSNTASYVKMIVEMLPEGKVSSTKKWVIKEIYNFFLNHFNADKKNEIACISGMFREKISISNMEDIAKYADYIYSNFIENIIFDSINREKIFDIMNESMKVYVGYYSEYRSANSNDMVYSKREKYFIR